jgi:hypothetical protein
MARELRRDLGAFAALWLLFMVAGRTRLLQDPGTFWHVAAGEHMLASGRVIDVDPFAVATHGKPWIAMQWLGELAMALLHRMGGFDALVACAAALLALLFAYLWRELRSQGARVGFALLLLGLTLAASAHHFLVRPHLVTMLGVAVTQASLLAFEERAPDRERRLLLLVPLFVLWTNLHGGVAGGLAMLAVVALGWALRFAARRSEVLGSRREARVVALALAGCSLAPLVNPYGSALPRTWLTLSSSRLLPEVIREHAPLPAGSTAALAVALLALLYVAALASVPLRAQRVTFVVPLLWLLLSVRSARHAPLFAVVTLLTLPRVLRAGRLWPARLSAHSRSLFALGVPGPSAPRFALAAGVLVLLGGVLAVQATGAEVPVLGRGWARPSARVAPLDLVPALHAAAAARPAGSGVLNEMDHGGFLVLRVPRLRVFIDDRWEVHGDQTFARYVHDSERDPAALVRWAEELGIDLALAPHAAPLHAHLASAPGWRLLEAGATASLYARTRSPLSTASR